ncbi:14802_t:CDS:1 [Funneliformis geosporum]|uniref:14802_t:CDS:1 n=1 Tax=Funneliformis geosporum TaxID=1117311 RepID=A0A9W4SCW4_9GLOM|nr:14802_t:CDS:1 [Funneliformis geosporum]
MNEGIKEYPKLKRPPLFDYIHYCKYMRYFNIRNMILLKLGYGYNRKSQYKVIEKEIFQLFISKCFDIKELQIIDIELELHNFIGADNCFSNLCKLECDTSINSTIFIGLARICKSIEHLFLNPCLNDNEGLIELIEAQRNLKRLICKGTKDQFENGQCYGIEKALKKQANSLIHFSIDNLCFSPTIFPILKNLQKLEITEKKHVCLNKGYARNLSRSKYSNLEILVTKNITHNIVEKIIEKTNGCLWKIDITNDMNERIDHENFIKIIYHHCPNIKFINILIHENKNLFELEQLLLNCQYLEGIVIESPPIYRSQNERINGNELLEIITRSAPIGLHKIKVYKNLEISLNSLITFFENWKGRIPLYFHTIMSYSKLNKDYLDIIEKYKNEGILKEYKDLNNYPSPVGWQN